MNTASDTLSGPPLSVTLRILLPFAAGYFLSYLYRTVNAVISPDLIAALDLDATALGLLTSVYFLAFALFQLPLGLLLDRYGPRRVEAALLLVAAAGAGVFAFSADLPGLILGRALIGIGVSGCLMASFKATTSWFEPSRVPAMNGWILAAGGLGALTATRPVELALSVTDWRGVITVLALATLAVAAFIFAVAPERSPGHSARPARLLQGVARIYRDRYFWRVVPAIVLTQSAFLSIQGLWAGPWFRDVAGFDRTGMANHLFFTAAAMVAGFLLIGNLASRLARIGIPLTRSLTGGLLMFMLVQLGIALELTRLSLPLWLLFGFFGSSSILAYPLLSQHFPPELSGRVNTSINLLVFSMAFVAQWAIGAIINLWPETAGGGYDPQGYQSAFGLLLLLQTAGYLWFLRGLRRGGADR